MEGATRLVVTSRQKPAAFVINMFCLNLARTWELSAWLSDIQTFITCLLNFKIVPLMAQDSKPKPRLRQLTALDWLGLVFVGAFFVFFFPEPLSTG